MEFFNKGNEEVKELEVEEEIEEIKGESSDRKAALARREANRAKKQVEELRKEFEKELKELNIKIDRLIQSQDVRFQQVDDRLQNRVTIETNSIKETMSGIVKMNPVSIMYDIEQVREAVTTNRDRLNDLEVWKSERLVDEVAKYKITHSTDEMQDMFKKCPLKTVTLAEMMVVDKALISKMINHLAGSALVRHQLFLIMTQSAAQERIDMAKSVEETLSGVIEQ